MSKQRRLIIEDVAKQFTEECKYIYQQCGITDLEVSYKMEDTCFKIIAEDKLLNYRFWRNFNFDAIFEFMEKEGLPKLHELAMDDVRMYNKTKLDLMSPKPMWGM